MSEWISVKDRLPEPHIEVLTFDMGQFNHISVDCLDDIIDGNSFFAQAGGSITHWMPLPEPPGYFVDDDDDEEEPKIKERLIGEAVQKTLDVLVPQAQDLHMGYPIKVKATERKKGEAHSYDSPSL